MQACNGSWSVDAAMSTVSSDIGNVSSLKEELRTALKTFLLTGFGKTLLLCIRVHHGAVGRIKCWPLH